MKRKLLAIIAIVCVAAFVLSACGNGGKSSGGSGGSDGGAVQTYDVGKFTVTVPAGWNAFPQDDTLEPKDAEGNYPIDPERILLAKDAKDEFEAYSKPCIDISWYSTNAYVLDSRSFYDNVKDISGVKIKGKECTAYSGTTANGYTYQCIHYEGDDAQYDFNIRIAIDGKDTGITWEDPEVKSILESVTVKTDSETESK